MSGSAGTPITFDSVGNNLDDAGISFEETDMQATVREFHEKQARDAKCARIMVVVTDLGWLVAYAVFLGLGTCVYIYNQTITTPCEGSLPSGWEAVQTLEVTNSTHLIDGSSLVFFQLDGVMISQASAAQLPSGAYTTNPAAPVCTRRWTAREGFYFGMVTATTVGYGDYSPTNEAMKGFTILYIALALIMAGSIIGICTRYVHHLQDFILFHLDDNPDDMDEPQGYKLLLSILLIVLTVIAGALFFQANEGWSFLDAFYWSFITSTTIGYGDMSLTKDSSRMFCFFYLLASTTFFAFGLGNIVGIQEEVAREEKRIAVMANNSNVKRMLAGSATGNVSSGEYLAAYLFEMGVVGHEDVRPVLARFKELDMDRSGYLDANDLKIKDTRTPKERRESMQRKMDNIKRIEAQMELALEEQERAEHEDEGELEKLFASDAFLKYAQKLTILAGYLAFGAAVMHGDDTRSSPCYDAHTIAFGGNVFIQSAVPSCTRPWSWAEGFYWASATVTTVGYGDYSPSYDGTKIFTIFYAFFGLGIASWAIFDTGIAVVEGGQNMVLKLLGCSTADDPNNDNPKLLKWKICINFCIFTAVLGTGTLFYMLNEDWTFIDAFYWSFVTSTTVGYGDMVLEQPSSRMFSTFYFLFSNALLLACISQGVGEAREISHVKTREKVLEASANVEMMLAADMSGDGRISEGEYLADFLSKMGLVSTKETQPVLDQFMALDVDSSGFLDECDLMKPAS
jgi:voltage-gated potassium channel Kch